MDEGTELTGNSRKIQKAVLEGMRNLSLGTEGKVEVGESVERFEGVERIEKPMARLGIGGRLGWKQSSWRERRRGGRDVGS